MGRLMLVDGEALDRGLTAVAEVIREKGEHEQQLQFPEGFVAAVEGLKKAEPEGESAMELHLSGKLTSYTGHTTVNMINYALAYNRLLKEVYFPLVETGGTYLFIGCSVLETARFPSITAASQGMFYMCKALLSADMPRITEVGQYAFQTCTALPFFDCYGATRIQQRAFKTDAVLHTLILRSRTLCTLDNVDALAETPIESGTGYVYVPAALIEEYRQGTNWSAYADQFRAIEDYPDITGGWTV